MTADLMPPFYVGQKVVGSDYCPDGSCIKKGVEYIINSCHYCQSPNPIANGKYFWYVGVYGYPQFDFGGKGWLSPRLFSPIQEGFSEITFEKIIELEKISNS